MSDRATFVLQLAAAKARLAWVREQLNESPDSPSLLKYEKDAAAELKAID